MDIGTVTEFAPAPGAAWRDGDAWLAGGTWLFSQPQPAVTRLLDLAAFGWPPLTETTRGLEIAATCTLAELARWRPAPGRDWPAARLARLCCEALLGSFKVQNAATVGGNICLSLPAGPMTSLAVALDGTVTIWPRGSAPGDSAPGDSAPGDGAREVPAAGFVTGDSRNVLRRGELLRSVFLPAGALRCRAAFRQVSLSAAGRSAVVVIARAGVRLGTVVTVTAATPRPVRIRLRDHATGAEAAGALDEAIRLGPGYLDDVHGHGAWRRAMTLRAAAEAVAELTAGPAS